MSVEMVLPKFLITMTSGNGGSLQLFSTVNFMEVSEELIIMRNGSRSYFLFQIIKQSSMNLFQDLIRYSA